jgi:SET domain-containing protein
MGGNCGILGHVFKVEEIIRFMEEVVVKESNIDECGVFALRNFKKGEIVLRWDYEKLTKEEVKKLPTREKRYVTCVGGDYIFLQKPERYTNHSCDANTYPENFCDIAKRDIMTGEEITTDYGKQAEPDFQMACKCGSKNCRKIIKSRV